MKRTKTIKAGDPNRGIAVEIQIIAGFNKEVLIPHRRA